MAKLLDVWKSVMAARGLRPDSDSINADVVNAARSDWAVAYAYNTQGEIVATVMTSVRVEDGGLRELPPCPHCDGTGAVDAEALEPGEASKPSDALESGESSKRSDASLRAAIGIGTSKSGKASKQAGG